MSGSELSFIDVILYIERNEELCINLGGLNREFFIFLLEDFKFLKLDMFEGLGSFFLFVNNRKVLNGDMFYLFGKIFVLLVFLDGFGFLYFLLFLVSYFRGYEFEYELSSLYIVNMFMMDYINKVYNVYKSLIIFI